MEIQFCTAHSDWFLHFWIDCIINFSNLFSFLNLSLLEFFRREQTNQPHQSVDRWKILKQIATYSLQGGS